MTLRNPFARKPAAWEESKAPLAVSLELWPDKMLGRATVTKDGIDQKLEISAPYMRLVLSALKALGVKF